MQPEGGGAFYEDPLGWIQEGGWNSVQDYDLFIWWEKRNVIGTALDTGDPRPIEQSLREYHDRVVAAGGVLYFYFPPIPEPPKDRLAKAMLASVGDLLASNPPSGSPDEERILAVMNFQPTPQTVEVDLSGVAGETFVDLTSGERAARRNPLPVKLPAYGYRFYRVE